MLSGSSRRDFLKTFGFSVAAASIIAGCKMPVNKAIPYLVKPMEIANQPIFHYLAQYAYQPEWVYAAVFGMMLASGFGLPLPEEVTLISLGALAFMGTRKRTLKSII